MRDIKDKKFYPKKSFGQNFLINKGIQERIVRNCKIDEKETILEIGPGKGAITKVLSREANKVIAIEKDSQLAELLKQAFQNTNVEIIESDILTFDFSSLPKGIKAVGNLPYNIATPIIEKIITNNDIFTDLFITVQLEYGLRLVSKPNLKTYGPLSCFIQYHCEPTFLFEIKNTAFNPKPKIKSCFIHLKILKTPSVKTTDEKLFFKLIKTAFNQRRKNLLNSLSSISNKEEIKTLLDKLGIDNNKRAENLTLQEFAKLTNSLSNQ